MLQDQNRAKGVLWPRCCSIQIKHIGLVKSDLVFARLPLVIAPPLAAAAAAAVAVVAQT